MEIILCKLRHNPKAIMTKCTVLVLISNLKIILKIATINFLLLLMAKNRLMYLLEEEANPKTQRV